MTNTASTTALAVDPTGGRPVIPAASSRRGAGLREISLGDGFWARLQDTNAAASFEHCYQWMERLGWLANFDRVAEGTTGADRPGWQFSDSEVYKLMEALAWEHGRSGSAEAADLLQRLTSRVGRAQDSDGYLNTCFGHPGQPPRYSDLAEGHELYCTGHLLQAAVARVRTHGVDELVRIAQRAADHVCEEFAERVAICGHPEIELGLAELGRALGEPRYVEQARRFIDRRGQGLLRPPALLSSAYFQDDVPVRDADAWRGHAVRALYLAAAAVDVGVDLADEELVQATQRQWRRSVERRTYLTGGMGSRHQDEGFGEDWELPADRAYCETCAGVASVMVSWRLYLATGEVRYADLIERTLFNVVATSPREDGRAFFYANPLHQRTPGVDVQEDAENPRAEGGMRAPWFDVSCCPTNVARTLATWQAYAASVDGDVVSILQYATSEMVFGLDGGGQVRLRLHTDYPVTGDIDVEVLDAPARVVTLRFRVPDWAAGATLRRGEGEPKPLTPGWADVRDVLEPGERLRLHLPVDPRFTYPDPRIDAVRGSVAVERGPVVLCLESVDLPDGVPMESVRIEPSSAPVEDAPGAVVRARVLELEDADDLPYYPDVSQSARQELDLRLVPYHSWAQRGPSTMRVFVPTT